MADEVASLRQALETEVPVRAQPLDTRASGRLVVMTATIVAAGYTIVRLLRPQERRRASDEGDDDPLFQPF